MKLTYSTLGGIALSFALMVSAAQGTTIAITEFLNNPSDDEWFELYNFGTTSVDLTGWTYSDEDTNSDSLPAITMDPGDVIIITTDKAAFESNWLGGVANPDVYEIGIGALANTTDEIIISDDSATVIWSVAYDDDETFPASAYLTTTDFTTTVYGSKASPGVDRSGNDVSGDLGYETASLGDGISFQSGDGDIGNPFLVVPEPGVFSLVFLTLAVLVARRNRRK
ncbi:MAG: lamin tail domain-containing protein [Verrucomicrobiota bacterium]